MGQTPYGPPTAQHTPAAKLRHELITARQDGQDFDDIWLDAIERAAAQSTERRDWLDAFIATREHWRSAYERQGKVLTLTADLVA